MENLDLLHGVIENPEDDLPRLVYADWLEETGDPHRAEFIRVRCALAACSPANPVYPDLLERYAENHAAMWRRKLAPPLPEGVGFFDKQEEEWDSEYDSFHRGFPSHMRSIHQVNDPLPEVIRITTIRGIRDPDERHWPEILRTPAAAHLTRLDIEGQESPNAVNPALAALAASPTARNLRWLSLNLIWSAADADALAAAPFENLERFDVNEVRCDPVAADRLTQVEWFPQLRRLSLRLQDEVVAGAVTPGLANLPRLHTLTLLSLPHTAFAALAAAGPFPQVGGLVLDRCGLEGAAAHLGRVEMPKLASLRISYGGIKNEDLIPLAGSGLFARLHTLKIENCHVGESGLAAVAASPSARQLRILHLCFTAFGKRGPSALTKPGAFPNLTTLRLYYPYRDGVTSADTAKFLAKLHLPRRRHLELDSCLVDDDGAKALATNPTFSNLTRLVIRGCGFQPDAAKALLMSENLKYLLQLDLHFGAGLLGGAAEVLTDPTVMPALVSCWFCNGRIPEEVARRLRAERPVVAIMGR